MSDIMINKVNLYKYLGRKIHSRVPRSAKDSMELQHKHNQAYNESIYDAKMMVNEINKIINGSDGTITESDLERIKDMCIREEFRPVGNHGHKNIPLLIILIIIVLLSINSHK